MPVYVCVCVCLFVCVHINLNILNKCISICKYIALIFMYLFIIHNARTSDSCRLHLILINFAICLTVYYKRRTQPPSPSQLPPYDSAFKSPAWLYLWAVANIRCANCYASILIQFSNSAQLLMTLAESGGKKKQLAAELLFRIAATCFQLSFPFG